MSIGNTTTLATIAFLLFGGTGAVHAAVADYKALSGAGCQPASPADATSLTYSAFGVTNTGAVSRTVVCALPSDAELWATQGVDIYLTGGQATCTLSIVEVDIDMTLTTHVTNVVGGFVSGHSPGSPFHIWFKPQANRYSGQWAPLVVTCRLAPKARLTEIRYLELGADTDGSGL